MTENNEIAILEFWHKLEFFSPHNAKQLIDIAQEEGKYQDFSREQLISLSGHQSIQSHLPKTPSDKKFNGAVIYFNLFNTSELSQIIQELLQSNLSENEQFTQEAMIDDGVSCYASLFIDENGEFSFSQIGLSTVPWALGLSRQKGIEALDTEQFNQDCQTLIKNLENIYQKHLNIQNQYLVESNPQATLSSKPKINAAMMLDILDKLNQWAYGFCPNHQSNVQNIPIIGICMRYINKSQDNSPTQHTHNNNETDNNKIDNNDDGNDDTQEFQILNSFYAQDIHRIIQEIKGGKISPTLSTYLRGFPNKNFVDLYGDTGNQTIWQTLRPKYWNKGRWLSEPAHGLSLMQQFAINTFFKENHQPIFSVNGPPGTGKTTLLRDIFAENMVQRAMVLATLPTAKDAFVGKILVEGRSISKIMPQLTGFEMVVASSNNAAVENISCDLPKMQSLGNAFKTNNQANFTYLNKIARNLFAKQAKKYDSLLADDDVWGLFSCALGKKSNRKKVQSGLFFVSENLKGFDANLHETIWQWRNNYQDLSFKQAQKNFKDKLKSVEQRLAQLDEYFVLHEKLVLSNAFDELTNAFDYAKNQLNVIQNNINNAQKELEQKKKIDINSIPVNDNLLTTIINVGTEIQAIQDSLQECNEQKIALEHQLQSLQYSRPGFFARLFNSINNQNHRKALADCHDAMAKLQLKESEYKKSLKQHIEQLNLTQAQINKIQKQIYQQDINTIQEYLQEQRKLYHNHNERLEQIELQLTEYYQDQELYKSYANKFAHIYLPKSYDELQNDDFQIKGLWQDDELNKERSLLFGCALQLHEAWLSEVSAIGEGFGSNISCLSNFLDNKMTLDKEQTLALWQSLFMIIPVVSSTFAAFFRQFCDLGIGSLGYLFIDEAGQAVPQAAVGAIWRAKRVMVVGDPIQIEPVFTVPPPLVRSLMKTSNLLDENNVSPLDVSVQILADKCNSFGAMIDQEGEKMWIGSPLRVHRRCLQPMFAIANRIAYKDKMILSETDTTKQYPKPQGFYLGESSWVQVTGSATSKQFVSAQADLVVQMLMNIIQHTNTLPELYIITPFKQVKNKLIHQILSTPQLQTTQGIKKWCNTCIGTVHTFQGKEENMVWLVLGCDKNTKGAAQWAASKPNLLNVALTRAKRYVFVIGDKNIWQDLPYFDEAALQLPQITTDEFLNQASRLSIDTE